MEADIVSIRERIMNELSLYVRSNFPFVYIVSSEENRVIAALEELARDLDRKIFVWSCSRGLYPPHLEKQASQSDHSFTEGMEDIRRFQGAALFVVLDGSRQLESDKVTRRLRDMQTELEQQSKTVFFVGIDEKIPKELRKDVYVIQFPLPGMDEMIQLTREVEKGGLDEGQRELIARSALGLTLREARRAFEKSKVLDGKLCLDDIEKIGIEKQRLIRQNGALMFYQYRETMQNVGGLDNLKEWVGQRDRAYTREAREFGLPMPKGMLLLGVQGCGKSLSCKAVAHQWRMPLLRLDLGAVYGSYVGMSEENIRNAIKMAEAIAPCILWIDEIEKGLAGLGSSNMTDAGTSSRVFSTFLTWMQEKNVPVFVAATANRLTGLPPELLRRGRFDEIFFVDLPNRKEKKEILCIHLEKHGRDPEKFDIDRHVEACNRFSGAEIEQAVINSLYLAFSEGTRLADVQLEKAIKEIVPLSQTMSEEIRQLQRWAYDRARPASGSCQE